MLKLMSHFFNKKLFFVCILAVTGSVGMMIYQNKIIHSQEALPQFTHPSLYSESHIWGQPLKTLFPDLINPPYVDRETASFFLQPNDDVYYFQSKNNIYVFPAFVLGYHHIVNDTIDGQPLIITTCLLTNTPVIYKRKINDKTLSFGVLGNLYHGNLIMYDKETDSEWIQLTGEAISGHYSDSRLDMGPPISQTKWKNIQDKKNILVLQPQLDLDFYHSFFQKYTGRKTGLSLLQNVKIRNDIDSYTNGIGITIHKTAKFYPLSQIQEKQVINDTIDGWHTVLIYNAANETTHIYRRYIEDKLLTFTLINNVLEDNETHSQWSFEGRAISGALKGESLEVPSSRMSYWFAWSSFYPNTTIWKNP